MRALVGALVFVLSCGSGSRQVQATVADAVAQAANVAAPVLVEEYRRALWVCLDASTDRPSYDVCRAKVDHDWTRVRLAWGHLRMAQDSYATALEKGTVTLEDYARGLRVAYCEFRADVPRLALPKVPELPGLPCGEFAGDEPRPIAPTPRPPSTMPRDGGAE